MIDKPKWEVGELISSPDQYNSHLISAGASIFWFPGTILVMLLSLTPANSYFGGLGAIIIAFWLNILFLPITVWLVLPCFLAGFFHCQLRDM